MQFVVYQFGVFITKLLQSSLEVPEVNLLLASDLPPNNYCKNAFRNSFHYEHARKMLYIRQERMDSVGDFIVLLIHCLAHIKVGDLTDDGNVLFLREFYKVSTVYFILVIVIPCLDYGTVYFILLIVKSN